MFIQENLTGKTKNALVVYLLFWISSFILYFELFNITTVEIFVIFTIPLPFLYGFSLIELMKNHASEERRLFSFASKSELVSQLEKRDVKPERLSKDQLSVISQTDIYVAFLDIFNLGTMYNIFACCLFYILNGDLWFAFLLIMPMILFIVTIKLKDTIFQSIFDAIGDYFKNEHEQ